MSTCYRTKATFLVSSINQCVVDFSKLNLLFKEKVQLVVAFPTHPEPAHHPRYHQLVVAVRSDRLTLRNCQEILKELASTTGVSANSSCDQTQAKLKFIRLCSRKNKRKD